MPPFNSTGVIGVAILNYTTQVTGNLSITLILIGIILFIIMIGLFGLPIDIASLFILPYILVCMAITSDMLTFGGVIILYLSILFAKNFFLN